MDAQAASVRTTRRLMMLYYTRIYHRYVVSTLHDITIYHMNINVNIVFYYVILRRLRTVWERVGLLSADWQVLQGSVLDEAICVI